MIRAGYNKSVNIGIIDKQFCFFHYVYFKQIEEANVQRYSVIKVFLKISLNSQENTCLRVSFLINLQA